MASTIRAEIAPPQRSRGGIPYEEFLAAPGYDGILAEWVDGEVQVLSPASFLHQTLVAFVYKMIDLFLEQGSGGIALFAPFQVKLGPGMAGREPDVIYVGPQRLDQIRANHLEGPPDLAVEVISPDSVERDHSLKFAEYAKAGVSEYWILDPEKRTADFFALGRDGVYARIEPDRDGRIRSRALDGLAFEPAWLWRRPHPSRAEILESWKPSQA